MSNVRRVFQATPKNAKPAKDKTEAKVIINANFVRRFAEARMDPDFTVILGHVQGKLSFTADASGATGAVIEHSKTGEMLGTAADIIKIASLNSGINEQRKAAQKESVNADFKKLIFALKEQTAVEDALYVPGIIPKSFMDIYRPLKSQMKVLSENVTKLRELSVEANSLSAAVKSHVEANYIRINNAVFEFLSYRFKGGDSRKVNDFLFDRGVPIWTFHKLADAKVTIPNLAFQYAQFYFPTDITKGFSLSFKEVRTQTFCDAQLGMLKNNEVLISFFANDGIIRTFVNLGPDDVLDFEEEPFAGLANIPILMLPPLYDLTEILATASSKSGKALAWNTITTLSAKTNLRFLGTLFKRLFYFSFPAVDRQVGIIQSLVPGFIYDAARRDVRILEQLKTWVEQPERTVDEKLSLQIWRRNIFRGPAKERMNIALCCLLQISEAANPVEYRTLHAWSPRGNQDIITLVRAIPNGMINAVDKYSQLKERAEAINPNDRVVEDWVKRHFDAKLKTLSDKDEKRLEQQQQRSMNALGTFGRSFVSALNRKDSVLAEKIETYLKSFMTEQISDAVARVLHTRYQHFFGTALDYSNEERSAYLDPANEIDLPELSDEEDGPAAPATTADAN